MKNITIAILVAYAIAMCGCASQVASNINTINGALTSPQANQAVANLKVTATTLICALNNISATAAQVEAQVNAGKAAVRDTNDVYVASSAVCAALGGTITK